MGAAQRWVLAGLAGIVAVTVAGTAFAAGEILITDKDRVVRNFTREAAVVEPQHFRVEVRGMHMTEETADHEPGINNRCNRALAGNCTRLDLQGQRVLGVESLNGGILELLISYGIAPGIEVGTILPAMIETVHLQDDTTETDEGFGDITLYGKFKYQIHQMISVAGGLELTAPTGDDEAIVTKPGPNPEIENGGVSGYGTGALGINPFISARFQWNRLAIESHLGYNFYTSEEINRVFNSSAAGIVKINEFTAFRVEFSQRVWDQFSTRWVDAVCMPGIDFNLTNFFTIRPTGLVAVTGTALDWGVGVGVAASM